MAQGIKDKVAILGMGCSKFGERWDASPEDLMVEAYNEAMADAGIAPEQLGAAWYSTHMDDVGTGRGGTPMGIALRLPNIGVTRVENFCAGGSEAIRAAVYAVAAGACDIALALGVEKLKDTGYGGLPMAQVGTYIPQWYPNAVAPANFAQLASAYRAKHGIDAALLKRAISHVSVKSHANGAKNPKAHLQKPITEEQCLKAPTIAAPLGLFDCCGVSDGAACAIDEACHDPIAAGVPDVQLVRRLVSGAHQPLDHAPRASAQAPGRVDGTSAVVARALDDRATRPARHERVECLLDERRPVMWPGVAAKAHVDDAGPIARDPRDEVHRLQQAHRVADAPRAGALARKVDEDQRRAGRDAAGPDARGSRRDVEHVGPMTTAAVVIRVGRIVVQRRERIRRGQGAVDCCPGMGAAVAVRLRTTALPSCALIPQRDHARSPVAPSEVRVRDVESPVDHTEHHAAAGGLVA
mgnify:CR=1 FL=1